MRLHAPLAKTAVAAAERAEPAGQTPSARPGSLSLVVPHGLLGDLTPLAANRRAAASYSFSVILGLPLTMKSR
jgi:hypothetical protein